MRSLAEILARKYDEPPRPQPARHNEPSDEEKKRSALALFKEARPIAGTLAERYLRGDSAASISTCCRTSTTCCTFIRVARSSRNSSSPCLLALFRDIVTDAPRAILRIAIADDLTKFGMLSLGSTTGAAMKISPDSEVMQGLCVAEGLETALSAMTIEHRGTWLRPMWALGGTSGLRFFPCCRVSSD